MSDKMNHFCQDQRLEALFRKRNQFHLKALQRQGYQGNHRQIYSKMTQLQNLNLPKDFTMVLTSLVMKMIQFSENLLIVLPMVIMVNGQDSTIKGIQRLLNIDICSGM